MWRKQSACSSGSSNRARESSAMVRDILSYCLLGIVTALAAAPQAIGQDLAVKPQKHARFRQADRVVGRSRLEGHPRARRSGWTPAG